MRRLHNATGFSLIELTILIIVVGILAGMAIQSMTTVLGDIRHTRTEKEMEALADAIVGNPELQQNGARGGFGYVGDIGAFPPNLAALYTNPGLPTWNGPYVVPELAEDTVSYRLDDWGQPYTLTGDIILSSTGGPTTLTKKLTDATDDYLVNTVTGLVTDKNDSLPGALEKDSVRIIIDCPRGASGMVSRTVYPTASGAFTIDSVPAGIRSLRAVYLPANDTLRRMVTVLPRHKSNPQVIVKFASAYFGGMPTYASEILRPNGAGSSAELTGSGCASNYLCVDEVSSDEATTRVVSSAASNQTDLYELTNHTGTGTVDSIRVYVRARGYGSGSGRRLRTAIRPPSATSFGASVDLDPVTSFTDYLTTHTTNPVTAVAWTWADIDALQAGVELKKNTECTQVWVVVYYHY